MPFRITPEFYHLLEEILPLFIIALLLCFLFGKNRIKESYKYDNMISWFIQYALTAMMTAVFAIAMILLLPVIFPTEFSYGVKLGIVLYICVFGVQSFQSIVRNKLGMEVVEKGKCPHCTENTKNEDS